jgi:hypothetical protein
MVPPGEPAAASPSQPRRRARLWVQTLRPEWALALALMLNGALNINSGLRYNLVPFSQIGPLSSLGESLSVLGSSTQAILGAFLVLLGLGVLRRLARPGPLPCSCWRSPWRSTWPRGTGAPA